MEGKNLSDNGKPGTQHFLGLDTPKEELPSLVGGGRDWHQSSIGLADIELYACKPVVLSYFGSNIHQRLGSWCRPRQTLVAS